MKNLKNVFVISLLVLMNLFSYDSASENWDDILITYCNYNTELIERGFLNSIAEQRFLSNLYEINSILTGQQKEEFIKFAKEDDSYVNFDPLKINDQINSLKYKVFFNKNKETIYTILALSGASIFFYKYPNAGFKTLDFMHKYQSYITPLFWIFLIKYYGSDFTRYLIEKFGSLFSKRQESKNYNFDSVTENFGSVIGHERVKNELIEVVSFINDPEIYNTIGVKFPKFILLVGDSGNGKELISRAIAGESGSKYLKINETDINDAKNLLDKAESNSPCILFIPKIHTISLDSVNDFLKEFSSLIHENIIVIASTDNINNVKEILNLKISKKIINVPMPDYNNRKLFLESLCKNKIIGNSIKFEELALKTRGFSYSDLQEIVNDAAIISIRTNKDAIEISDFKNALNNFKLDNIINDEKIKSYIPIDISSNFDSSINFEKTKEESKDSIDLLSNKLINNDIAKCLLLVGPKGNGKFTFVKSVAMETNCPLFVFNSTDKISIKDLILHAKKNAPSIVFISNIEEYENEFFNEFFELIQEFSLNEKPVLFVASTQKSDLLNSVSIRKAKLIKRIDFPYPEASYREKYLINKTKNMNLDTSIDFSKLAQLTYKFSYADLSTLIDYLALDSKKINDKKITFNDFELSISKIQAFKKLNSNDDYSNIFVPVIPKEKFDSVGGLIEEKEELQDIINYLKDPIRSERLGAKLSKGIILYGQPGNGKSLLAKSVAGHVGCLFYEVQGKDLTNVKDLFNQALKCEPSIIFIKNVELMDQQSSKELFNELRDLNKNHKRIVVLASCSNSNPEEIKQFIEPDTFEKVININSPDVYCREEILKIHTKKIKLDTDVDLNKIARRAYGFTSKELVNLINEALLLASRNEKNSIVKKIHFEQALDKISFGLSSKAIKISDKEKKVTAYHESGHALVWLLNKHNLAKLHKVTIVPNFNAGFFGINLSLEGDIKSYSKEDFIGQIEICFGGRLAEEIVFGLISEGASSDFRYATYLAQLMIRQLGMSKLGIAVLDNHYFGFSQKTYEKIDKEVESILKECYKKVKKLLETNRDKLDKIANALLKNETLYVDEICKLIGVQEQ